MKLRPVLCFLLGLLIGMALVALVKSRPQPNSVSPIEPSKNDLQAIQKIEEELKTGDSVLQNEMRAQELKVQFDAMLEKMPPLAQDAILPRLAALQWSLRTLPLLTQESQSGKIQELIDTLSNALGAEPPDVNARLTEAINRRLQELREAQKREILQQVEGQLRNGATKEQLNDSIAEIERMTNGSDSEIMAAKTKLAAQLIKQQLPEIAAMQDVRLMQAAAAKAYDLSISLRLGMSGTDSTTADIMKSVTDGCEELMEKVATVAQERDAAKVRRYQRWALNQIQVCKESLYDKTLESIRQTLADFKKADSVKRWSMLDDYPSLRKNLSEKIGIEVSEPDISIEQQKAIHEKIDAKEFAYMVVAEAMVKYLLPIQDRLLDPSVQQLFSEVYGHAWESLKGRPEQLYVAEHSVDVRKVTPNDPQVNQQEEK